MIPEGVARALRGTAASRVLARCGVDPKGYWLLVDLFHAISERGEMLDQLGRNGVALGTAALIYAVFSAFFTVFSLVLHLQPGAHLGLFLFFTGFIFLSVLLSEAGNSLVNPVEGLVLAHQPISGATYTAAKLSHLLRIVLWLAPALNAVPAVAGLALPGARWFYPFAHLGAALAIGLVAALLCCAAFGWLMRFVPARRLKAFGQFAGAIPFVAAMWMGQAQSAFRKLSFAGLVPDPAARRAVAVAAVVAAIAIVVLGLRALSADYLIRVSSMMRGGGRAGAGIRRSATGALAAFFGGQPARAGVAFTGRLMLRDWQFRRQFVGAIAPLAILIGSAFAKGWKMDPFGAAFSPIHFTPHAVGLLLVMVSVMLPFGSDYKGGWVFLLAPPSAADGFAAGVYAVLVRMLVVLHAIGAPFLVWKWGAAHAALFLAFSAAAASLYVAASLRLLDGIPFTRQPDPKRSALTLPILMVMVMVVAIAVAIQHFLLFRSAAAVAGGTVGLAIGGWVAGRGSIGALGDSMRNELVETSGEAGSFYREIEV